jgi:hypothetical protein
MQFFTETATITRLEDSQDTRVSKFIYDNFNTLFDEDEQFDQLSNRSIQWRFEQEVARMVQHLRQSRTKKDIIFRSTLTSMLSYNFNISLHQAKWMLRSTYALEKIAKDYGGVYSTLSGARIEFDMN